MIRQLKDLNSPLLSQVLPLLEQLPPLYSDLANGREEFVPAPPETKNLVRQKSRGGRSLLHQHQFATP